MILLMIDNINDNSNYEDDINTYRIDNIYIYIYYLFYMYLYHPHNYYYH